MAFRLGDAVVFFGGDTSELDQKTENSEGGLKKWASNATSLIGGAVVGAAATAGAAIAAVGVAAFNVSADTEKASRKMQAQLGVTREEADRLALAARGVFGSNFAGSVEEAGEAVSQLVRDMGDAVTGQEQTLTEYGFAISDAFGAPIDEVIRAAATLQEEFDNLSPQEAFDLIAAGFQSGLDKSGDFLDSIGEYSNLFADADFSASEFFCDARCRPGWRRARHRQNRGRGQGVPGPHPRGLRRRRRRARPDRR